jgi:hypothetical protein
MIFIAGVMLLGYVAFYFWEAPNREVMTFLVARNSGYPSDATVPSAEGI